MSVFLALQAEFMQGPAGSPFIGNKFSWLESGNHMTTVCCIPMVGGIPSMKSVTNKNKNVRRCRDSRSAKSVETR